MMYFHNGDPDHPKQMDFSKTRNNPIYIPMDWYIYNNLVL